MPTPDEIAEEFVDRVLQYYDTKGIVLSYYPIVCYLPTQPPLLPEFPAVTKRELDFQLDIYAKFMAEVEAIVFRESYKVRVSQEAILDYTEIMADYSKALFTPRELEQSVGDIFIFPRFTRLKKREKLGVIAHKVWHLIETEQGLVYDHVLISEGTATYAMWRLLGQKDFP
ncbi:hypothetical protein DRJ48_05555, partial [Candidatus Woesearchaeota archaeon]